MKGVLDMVTFTLAETAEATGGRIDGRSSAAAAGVITDSRVVAGGELFVALSGPRFKGCEFVGQAFARGAWGAVVEEEARESHALKKARSDYPGRPMVFVGDTERALGDLARYHRRRFPLRVIGITGSNGKTTTKEMTFSIVSRTWRVHKSGGNFNNLVGLPLTILQTGRDKEVAVLEMGMNRPGEIARLAEIAEPEIGVITNVSGAHLEHLHSLEGVMAAKRELLEGMDREGTAILNADDPSFKALASAVRGRLVTFGTGGGADFRAEDVRPGAAGTFFTLSCSLGTIEIHIAFPGIHNVMNALAAAAAAFSLGAGLEDIRAGLGVSRPMPMRFAVERFRPGVTVINDAYNANPASMRAALDSLRLIPGSGRRAAVLGDMLELGDVSDSAHIDLGRSAAAAEIDLLLAVGSHAAAVTGEAVRSGLGKEQALNSKDWEEAADLLEKWLQPGDIVLLKGSRGVGLERVVQRLLEKGALSVPAGQEGEGA